MRRLLLLLSLLTLAGCETLGYYAQSAGGQLQLMNASQDIDTLLADPTLSDSLQRKLQQVQAIRRFAVQRLALPDNASYTRYADVGREALVWSLVAAPRLGLDAYQWCYPVIGCASYRGYFDPTEARAKATQMDVAGWDAAVERVPAYSTLGWFSDPLPSTVIDWPEADLAGLMFHELAHQRVYARDDSAFNESFATVVEREGVKRWLQRDGVAPQQAASALQVWQLAQRRAGEFRDLLDATRERLQVLYARELPEARALDAKREVFEGLRRDYQRLRQSWGGYRGYDRWMQRELNNAHLASQRTYSRWVPALQALLTSLDGDLERFHQVCGEQAQRTPQQRLAWLSGLQALLAE